MIWWVRVYQCYVVVRPDHMFTGFHSKSFKIHKVSAFIDILLLVSLPTRVQLIMTCVNCLVNVIPYSCQSEDNIMSVELLIMLVVTGGRATLQNRRDDEKTLRMWRRSSLYNALYETNWLIQLWLLCLTWSNITYNSLCLLLAGV